LVAIPSSLLLSSSDPFPTPSFTALSPRRGALEDLSFFKSVPPLNRPSSLIYCSATDGKRLLFLLKYWLPSLVFLLSEQKRKPTSANCSSLLVRQPPPLPFSETFSFFLSFFPSRYREDGCFAPLQVEKIVYLPLFHWKEHAPSPSA